MVDPTCQLLEASKNEDFVENVYFYFVDSTNANEPGSKWQIKSVVPVHGVEADLIFDILLDDSIGGVEVWHHWKDSCYSKEKK